MARELPWLRPGFRVREDASLAQVTPGEVLVGLGDEKRHPGCVVLNHKPRTHGTFRSVTEFVCSPAAPVEAWRALASVDALQLVVEDGSLDTCYGLLAFMERLEPGSTGVPLEGPWVEYVTQWELGAGPDAGALERSVGILLGQLSDSRDPAEYLPRGLEFLKVVCTQNPDPLRVDWSLGAPHLDAARARMDAEVARFESLRAGGESTTLELPRADGTGAVAVHALVATYEGRLGLLARLARARGYGLTALYCPELAGKGSDMVVATDPALNVTLRALWEALERLEDERWGTSRPRAHPRKLVSYAGSPSPPDEPWWDDLGRHTLVAAPKSVQVNGRQAPGSRVSWDDVTGLLKRLYG